MILVLKIWPDRFSLSTRPRPICLDLAETCAIGLDISVSETRSNHTDLAEPDLLYKSSSKHVKVLEVPKYPTD